MKRVLICLLAILPSCLAAQLQSWGDQGDGTYKNPVICADFSDPDVIRVNGKYYMVASDFHFLGMQVLESEDGVNWRYASQILCWWFVGSSHPLSQRHVLRLLLYARRRALHVDRKIRARTMVAIALCTECCEVGGPVSVLG